MENNGMDSKSESNFRIRLALLERFAFDELIIGSNNTERGHKPAVPQFTLYDIIGNKIIGKKFYLLNFPALLFQQLLKCHPCYLVFHW